ncbi:MAG: hypothetical protein JWN23_2857 [Rhodocyclales bacterium]|nr:hypothetical protein [Rhodocyclales bacterium]
MRSVSAVLSAGMMIWLSGCVSMNDETPVPTVVPVEALPTPTEEEAPAPPPVALFLPPPKSAPTHPTGLAPAVHVMTKQQETPVAKMVEQAPTSAPSSKQATREVKKDADRDPAKEAAKDKIQALPGPAWLKGCQHRQQQGDVIMCDADSLLAEPSDKVMVYVREAKLSRKLPGGQNITLRESLPRLYRIFVLQ